MNSIQSALSWARDALSRAGVTTPGLDCRLLLCQVLGCSQAGLIARSAEALAPGELDRFKVLVRQRCTRVPMAHILGRKEFWGLDLEVSGDVLIPRPDSETLVEAALGFHKRLALPEDCTICDLGTGSGALLLALLAELGEATGTGVDISEAALAIAQKNGMKHGLGERCRFVRADFSSIALEPQHLIVCNPPYICSGDLAGLDPDVRDHDPMIALDGGADGLAAYRQLAPVVGKFLHRQGVLVLEIGAGQKDSVGRIFKEIQGLFLAETVNDLAGHTRVLVIGTAATMAKLQQCEGLSNRGQKKGLESSSNRASLPTRTGETALQAMPTGTRSQVAVRSKSSFASLISEIPAIGMPRELALFAGKAVVR